jgi:Ca2+-binding EF-hand superfamily protein
MPSPVIAALDTDKNGTISAEELEKAVESLKTLDKNNDGKLTPEELRPPGGPGGGPGGPGLNFDAEAMLDRAFQADADGDGKLSKEEAPSRMRENFDRIDADGDGGVTKEEMKAAFERMREGGGRGPREGEGGNRGPREGGDRGPREGGDRGPREGGDRGPREGGDRGPSEGDSPEL